MMSASDPLRREQGSVLVEFALLSPIYVLVVWALFFHFGLTNAMLDGARAVIFAVGTRGLQTEADLPADYFRKSGVMVHGSSSTWTLSEEEGPEYFTEDLIFGNLEEAARDPIGHYVYSNGEFHYILDADHLSPWGEYIFNNHLQDYSSSLADIMGRSIMQTTATSELTFVMPFHADQAWTQLNHPQIEDTTSVIRKVQTAVLPLAKNMGAHEREGETNFNQATITKLYHETIPHFNDLNTSFWQPN